MISSFAQIFLIFFVSLSGMHYAQPADKAREEKRKVDEKLLSRFSLPKDESLLKGTFLHKLYL